MKIKFENSLEFAVSLDKSDPLRQYRDHFHLPEVSGKKGTYFCGNSLGLQPKSVLQYIQQELNDWASLGVEGHIEAKNPWVTYHKMFSHSLASLVGALPHEVVAMNTLTTNLHLMLSAFYRPSKTRFKIITEAGSFSSDIYALESQVLLKGLDPETTIIEVKPRTEEFIIHGEDILKAIDDCGDQLSLVLIGGVNYYTGQAFDMKTIAEAAHKAGAFVGFDLAHAIGNISLNLHLWEVDFAVWCTYKYLNSGPGGVGGLYIHEKFGKNPAFPRLTGWWAHREADRFQMPREFVPESGANGFQLSNAPVLSMAALRASMDIFDKAGIKNIIQKSQTLTAYLEYLIVNQCNIVKPYKKNTYSIKIITPGEPGRRGAQLSVLILDNGRTLFEKLIRERYIVDWRSPDVIRVAPVPLYNTFQEVYHFAKLLSETCCHI